MKMSLRWPEKHNEQMTIFLWFKESLFLSVKTCYEMRLTVKQLLDVKAGGRVEIAQNEKCINRDIFGVTLVRGNEISFETNPKKSREESPPSR